MFFYGKHLPYRVTQGTSCTNGMTGAATTSESAVAGINNSEHSFISKEMNTNCALDRRFMERWGAKINYVFV